MKSSFEAKNTFVVVFAIELSAHVPKRLCFPQKLVFHFPLLVENIAVLNFFTRVCFLIVCTVEYLPRCFHYQRTESDMKTFHCDTGVNALCQPYVYELASVIVCNNNGQFMNVFVPLEL